MQHQPGVSPTAPDPFPGVTGRRRSWASLDCSRTLYRVSFIEFLEDDAAGQSHAGTESAHTHRRSKTAGARRQSDHPGLRSRLEEQRL